jgi:hypothetical protein
MPFKDDSSTIVLCNFLIEIVSDQLKDYKLLNCPQNLLENFVNKGITLVLDYRSIINKSESISIQIITIFDDLILIYATKKSSSSKSTNLYLNPNDYIKKFDKQNITTNNDFKVVNEWIVSKFSLMMRIKSILLYLKEESLYNWSNIISISTSIHRYMLSYLKVIKFQHIFIYFM